MKKMKTSSLYRLLAFLLFTVLLISMVCIVVDGWSAGEKPTGPSTNSSTEEDAPDDKEPLPTPEPSLPEYLHYLTGLPVTKEESELIPLAFLLNPSSSIYGISNSLLTVEFQTESEGTRLLNYVSQSASLGKIGSIAKNRKYIQNITKSFGGIAVHAGYDDTVEYGGIDTGITEIDLSKNTGYSYTENTVSLFTNSELIGTGIDNASVPSKLSATPRLPFVFADYFGAQIRGNASAASVYIPFGLGNETSLFYSEDTGLYTYQKGGAQVTDKLNGQSVTYKNAFVLFCDAVTYELSNTTETVLHTHGSGSGYYFTNGTVMKILWSADENGVLTFTDTAGRPLTVNRGNTYISFFKASQKNKVTIY